MEKQWEQLSGIGPAVSMSYATCLNLCRLFATICCREVSIEEPGTPPFDLTPLPIRVACPDDLQPSAESLSWQGVNRRPSCVDRDIPA
jgi:hypothetical protein